MGILMCVDAFLFHFTVLPLRCALAGLRLVVSCLEHAFGWKSNFIVKNRFHRIELYDVLRGLTMVVCCFFVTQLQLSFVYHYIRNELSQNTIKLYVIAGMLEVTDKLFCSVGQDVVSTVPSIVALDCFSCLLLLPA